MIYRRTKTRRHRAGRFRGKRAAAWFGVLALCLNLLVPVAVLAAAPPPAEGEEVMCTLAPAGLAEAQPLSAPSHAVRHHCPLCLVLAGGVVAPPGSPLAAVFPPPLLTQPRPTAPTLPPASARLITPQPRAPPLA